MPKNAPAAAPRPPAPTVQQLIDRRPLLQLKTWAQTVARVLAKVQIVEWSDTPRGIVVDCIPNPKRYAIIDKAGVVISIDCGNAGMSVKPPS